MVKTASCNNKGTYSNWLLNSSVADCTHRGAAQLPRKRALITSISAEAAIGAHSGALLYKRYEQQSKTTTFLKNDMREDSGPCRKQTILSRGTLNDGCKSNHVIVSCKVSL